MESEGVNKFLNFRGVVFTDSGAYQAMRGKELEVDNREIVLFQKKIKSDVGIFLDVPTADMGYVEAKRTVFDTVERAKECKRLKKPIYSYFLVGTPRNEKIIEMIGWPTTTTMDNVEEYAMKLEGLVDGIIATCAGDPKGDLELLRKLQKFRK